MGTMFLKGGGALGYECCGSFRAPGEEWIHLTRHLTNYELLVVTEGTLYIADARKQYEVHEGEYLLMEPTPLQHGYRKSRCAFDWLHLEMRMSKTAAGPETLETDPIVLSGCGRLVYPERVVNLLKQLQESSRAYRNTELNDCLSEAVLREISCQESIYQGAGGHGSSIGIFDDVVDFIHYNIGENIRVSDMAAHFGYNSKYLTAMFKKHSGVTIKKYILQAKMESAMAELADTSHSVSQIAYGLGFQDVHNFTNAFKKVVRLSPSQYREKYSEKRIENA